MKKEQQELISDGHIWHEGKMIYYRVENDNRPIRIVHREEKISGFLHFFDSKKQYGFMPFYENFEDMSPVRYEVAEKYFVQLLKRNEGKM